MQVLTCSSELPLEEHGFVQPQNDPEAVASPNGKKQYPKRTCRLPREIGIFGANDDTKKL
jgi:hypothetical protein